MATNQATERTTYIDAFDLHGAAPAPDVHFISLVDLLAEAFVAKLAAANDTAAPRSKG